MASQSLTHLQQPPIPVSWLDPQMPVRLPSQDWLLLRKGAWAGGRGGSYAVPAADGGCRVHVLPFGPSSGLRLEASGAPLSAGLPVVWQKLW